MIISVDITEQDKKRLDELKNVTEALTRSSVLRNAIREYHKKIFGCSLSTVSTNDPSSNPPGKLGEPQK